MEKKKLTILLCAIFVLALVLRVGFIMTLNNSVDVWGDWWDDLGWKLATGQGYWVNNPYFAGGTPFYSWRAPGFPFLLSLIYRLFGHSYLAAKIGLAFFSSLTAIILYLAGLFLIDKKAGVLCAAIYAVYPASIFWTGYLAPETLTAFLVVALATLVVLIVKTDRAATALCAGIVFGFLFLTRPLAIVLFPVILIYFLLERKRKFLKFAAMFCAGCLVIIPWTMRNYRVHHAFVLGSTEGGVVFYIANNEKALSEASGFYHGENIEEFKGLSEVGIDRKFYEMGLNFVKRHPGIYWKLVADRFVRFWRFFPHTISGPGEPYGKKHVIVSCLTEFPLILLGCVGFLFSLQSWRRFFLPYGFIITFSAGTILIRATIRYRFAIMPLVIIFAVYAVRLWQQLKEKHVQGL